MNIKNINVLEIVEDSRQKLTQICEILSILNDEKEYLNSQIKKYARKESGLRVSDHSIIQYLRRIKGINIDEIKEEIVKDGLYDRYKVLGDDTYDQGNFRVVVNNATTITILPPK